MPQKSVGGVRGLQVLLGLVALLARLLRRCVLVALLALVFALGFACELAFLVI